MAESVKREIPTSQDLRSGVARRQAAPVESVSALESILDGNRWHSRSDGIGHSG